MEQEWTPSLKRLPSSVGGRGALSPGDGGGACHVFLCLSHIVVCFWFVFVLCLLCFCLFALFFVELLFCCLVFVYFLLFAQFLFSFCSIFVQFLIFCLVFVAFLFPFLFIMFLFDHRIRRTMRTPPVQVATELKGVSVVRLYPTPHPLFNVENMRAWVLIKANIEQGVGVKKK